MSEEKRVPGGTYTFTVAKGGFYWEPRIFHKKKKKGDTYKITEVVGDKTNARKLEILKSAGALTYTYTPPGPTPAEVKKAAAEAKKAAAEKAAAEKAAQTSK